MAAIDEIFQLEKDISDLTKGLTTAKGQLTAAMREVQKALDKVAADRHALNVAQANLRHMRQVADHVVLAEFVEVKKTEAEKKEDLSSALLELAKAEKKKRRLESNIPLMEGAKAARQKALKGYGQLEDFPKQS